MVTNPFQHSRPLPGDQVIDRESEVKKIKKLALGRHFMRLTAPRRFGKTSLLKKVQLEKSLIVVIVDLYGVLSLEDLTSALAFAYRNSDLPGAMGRRVAGVLASLEIAFEVGAPGAKASVRKPPSAPASNGLHQLLELPMAIAEHTKKQLLIAFDEFQQVLRVENADALIRSHIQHHDKVTYLFAGSEPSMIGELFDTKTRPLFGQATPMTLGPLPNDVLAEEIGRRFEETGRSAGSALPLMLRRARGHPQRAMLLAHHLWECTSPKETADESVWADAFAAAMSECANELDALWNRMDDGEQRLLKVVVASRRGMLEKSLLEAVGTRRSTARDAATRLIARAELTENADRGFTVVDPLLEEWVRRIPSEWTADRN